MSKKTPFPIKIFPKGSDLDEVEDYLQGDKTPKFIVSKPTEMAVRFLKQISFRKPDYFTPYEVDQEIVLESGDNLLTLDEVSPFIVKWARHSVFWAQISLPSGETWRHYMFLGVVAKNEDLYPQYKKTQALTGGWVTRSTIYRFYADDEKLDLTAAAGEYIPDLDRKQIIEWGLTMIANVTDGLLNRAVEYVKARGTRTARDRIHHIPALIIVSLSRPKRITEKNQVQGHSGIKMPEHDVMGHWRHLKNNKVVWVSAHKRGDPNVLRRTITRVVA
jgi:hypothetical protein